MDLLKIIISSGLFSFGFTILANWLNNRFNIKKYNYDRIHNLLNELDKYEKEIMEMDSNEFIYKLYSEVKEKEILRDIMKEKRKIRDFSKFHFNIKELEIFEEACILYENKMILKQFKKVYIMRIISLVKFNKSNFQKLFKEYNREINFEGVKERYNHLFYYAEKWEKELENK